MDCGTNHEDLLGYVDGELDAAERARVAQHIVACATCRAAVDDLKAVSGALARWPAPEPKSMPSARDLLATAGFEPAPEKPVSRWSLVSSRWGQAAALVLVAGVTAVLVVPRLTSDRPAPATPQATVTREGESGTTSDAMRQSTPADQDQPKSDQIANGNAGEADGTPSGPEATPPAEPNAGEKAGETGTVTGADKAEADQEAPASLAGGIASMTEEKRKLEQPAKEVAGQAGGGEAAPAPPPAPKPAAAEPTTEEQPRDNRVARREDAPVSKSMPSSGRARAAFGSNRKIRRGVLRLESKDLDSVIDRVNSVAQAAGGRLVRRGAVEKKQDANAVTVEIQVPAESFDRAFARIKGIAKVKSENQSSVDISAQVDELDDRDEAGSRAAGKTKDAKQSESADRERQQLEERAKNATIVVTVVEPDKP